MVPSRSWTIWSMTTKFIWYRLDTKKQYFREVSPSSRNGLYLGTFFIYWKIKICLIYIKSGEKFAIFNFFLKCLRFLEWDIGCFEVDNWQLLCNLRIILILHHFFEHFPTRGVSYSEQSNSYNSLFFQTIELFINIIL